MKTSRSAGNPHGHDRYAFAWEYVPPDSRCHLDIGCYDGEFLVSLKGKMAGKLVGADVCLDAIREARAKAPDTEFVHLDRTVPLPFAKETFTFVTILDVLEHVYEQEELLQELHRVMVPAGRLIVTTPRQYLLSFLDLGNLKFLFPRLHRWYYCRRHSRQAYEYRYVSNPCGLVGDISARKRWHEHFTASRLGGLLERSGFRVVCFDGSAFFTRPMVLLDQASNRFGWYKELAK
jgi:ubiquinone/menaquinone biosynthesis C-methylase UbiE